jgi:hypothetical protein
VTQPSKILFATPCYGGLVSDRYLMSMLSLSQRLAAAGIAFDLRTIADSLITRARNHFAGELMEDASFTHLMFIDADLGFAPEAVLRLIAAGKDLACGVYPLKRLDVAALRASPSQSDALAEVSTHTYSSAISIAPDNLPQDGFLRAEYGATGFMLIARGVLARMAEAYPALRYGGDHTMRPGGGATRARYAFFDTMISDGQSLPEDYSFCKRWRQIGGEIWIDLESRLAHVGTHVWRGDLGAALGEWQRQGRFG